MHDDELRIDVPLVRRLIAARFPQYAGLPIAPLPASGSSNRLFRLGDELLVRLPRQPGGSATIEKEARWSPLIAAGVTVGVPAVIAVGEPRFGYPEKWSVVGWLDGRTPVVPFDPVTGSSVRLADELACLVAELGALPVPEDARKDPALRWYRGDRLAALDEDFHHLLRAARDLADLDLGLSRAGRIWDDALAAERSGDARTAWFHGDLLAENLLLRDGGLIAVLDLGGLGIGDPTVDLIVAWEVLDPAGRERFRGRLGVEDAAWTAAKGWALIICLMTFDYYWHTMPDRCAVRRSMAAAVLAGD